VGAGLVAVGIASGAGWVLSAVRAPQPVGEPAAVQVQVGPAAVPVGAGPGSGNLTQPKGGTVGDANKKYTRQELKAAVTGKTPEEVIAILGRPTGTDDNPDGSPRKWHFRGRVLDPATGQYDWAQLDFRGGKVAAVSSW
jgi:hypothetical protein